MYLFRKALSKKPIEIKNGKWYFRRVNIDSETQDSFDRIKLLLKKYPHFYYFLIDFISPVFSDHRPLKRFLNSTNGLVLNIGSGNSIRKNGILNVDMMDYSNVDLVCDIHNLPFKDNSVDGIMNFAVLEHVKKPQVVLKEIYRVLKPGGRVFSVIPFMQPFHASPQDYQRYTLPGIEFLHRDFEKIKSGVFSGPVSGTLWIFQECLACIFSFGYNNLKIVLTILLLSLTWPIKFLDFLAIQLPAAENAASNFYFHGLKRKKYKK